MCRPALDPSPAEQGVQAELRNLGWGQERHWPGMLLSELLGLQPWGRADPPASVGRGFPRRPFRRLPGRGVLPMRSVRYISEVKEGPGMQSFHYTEKRLRPRKG